MNYAIITENDESQWEDRTGVSYNYPARYNSILSPGTRVIYYKGKIKDEKYEEHRLSRNPHYFGAAIIGERHLDPKAKRKEYHCDILSYQPFEKSIEFKFDGKYLESIPETKKSNYWRDGVREINKETFQKILNMSSIVFDDKIEKTSAQISLPKFDVIYSNFNEFIKSESDGHNFRGFTSGFVYEREGYKEKLREKAINILSLSQWDSTWIGTKKIIKKVVEIIELDGNNLVGTRRKYGPDSVPHINLLRAYKEGEKLFEIEQILYELFIKEGNYEAVFHDLIDLIGKQYSVIAFLFYVKNDRKFLPISTTNFEFAFELLGCNLKLSKHCDWINYNYYLDAIRQVKVALEVQMNENINLIDAHSFCWMIGHKNRYVNWLKTNKSDSKEIKFFASIINPVNNKNKQAANNRTPKANKRNSNVDWDQEDRKKRIKGRKAEEFVIEFEKERLKEQGKSDLAAAVEDYSKKLGQGFDVLSWNTDGSERRIEVKASSSNSFIITRNELLQSEKLSNYWIYVVNEKSNSEIDIKMIEGPLFKDNGIFQLEPKDYFVNYSIDND